MAKKPLSAIDLNLLVAFDALISERHVSRAAQKLGRSQSALSHALARLRDLFQDELFVRSQQSMQATQRALELAMPIRAALDRIDLAIHSNPAFDPAEVKRTFTLGMSDYTAFLFLPRLICHIRRVAPGIKLLVRHANRDEGSRWVLSGEIDLALGNFAKTSTRLHRHVLYEEQLVCVSWQGHTALSPPTLDDYLTLPHLLVSINGEPSGIVDHVLGIGISNAILAPREDVGRHNAVDKLVGQMVLTGAVPLAAQLLLVSGRTSFEIMQKAAMAQVPIVCGVSAPSSLAVEVAQQFGMTLVGFLRQQGCNIYTHPERIVLESSQRKEGL